MRTYDGATVEERFQARSRYSRGAEEALYYQVILFSEQDSSGICRRGSHEYSISIEHAYL